MYSVFEIVNKKLCYGRWKVVTRRGSQHSVSLYMSLNHHPLLMTKYMFIIKALIASTTDTVV